MISQRHLTANMMMLPLGLLLVCSIMLGCSPLPICASDADCGDDDVCTTDMCDNGTCVYMSIPGCGGDNMAPVAYYPFDGSADDASGNGNHGLEHGDYAYSEGVREQAVSLDGQTGYVDLQENTELDGFDEFTIAIWVRPATNLNASTGRQDILYKGWPAVDYSRDLTGFIAFKRVLTNHDLQLVEHSDWLPNSAIRGDAGPL